MREGRQAEDSSILLWSVDCLIKCSQWGLTSSCSFSSFLRTCVSHWISCLCHGMLIARGIMMTRHSKALAWGLKDAKLINKLMSGADFPQPHLLGGQVPADPKPGIVPREVSLWAPLANCRMDRSAEQSFISVQRLEMSRMTSRLLLGLCRPSMKRWEQQLRRRWQAGKNTEEVIIGPMVKHNILLLLVAMGHQGHLESLHHYVSETNVSWTNISEFIRHTLFNSILFSTFQ